MHMESEYTIVIGSSSPNSLGVVESLGLKKIFTWLILLGKSDNPFVCKSKYVKKTTVCENEDELLSCLIKYKNSLHSRVTIITTNDKAACMIDHHYDELIQWYNIPNAQSNGRINSFVDKTEQAKLANTIGLMTPKTWVYQDGILPEDVEFPCITKAETSLEGSKTLQKIFRERDSLITFLKECGQERMLIQKYIDKQFEFQFLGLSLEGGNKVIIPGRTHIVRPNGIQNGFFLEYFPIEDGMQETLTKTKAFIKATAYEGLFSVEFLHDASGVDFFTEMNFRNDGNSICVTKAGFNLPYIWCLYGNGEPIDDELNEIINFPTVYLLPEAKYFGSLLTKEISFKEWIHNVRKANCYYLHFKGDRLPEIFFWYNWSCAMLKVAIGKILK